ncbi:MAG: permease [Spirochaetales bacterium]|nr:permease [Spirochaetales bacterium]
MDKEEKMNNKQQGNSMNKAGNPKMGKQKKNKKGSIIVLAGIILAAVILLVFFPENREPSLNASFNLFKELIFILPAVMVLMGLFTVWVSKETVIKYLGHAAGVKGLIIALVMGMMPTGPLYVAFPMASMLLKKGARVANIIIFLSAWACIKLPQELVELRFMGIKFMVVRLSFTIVMVILMGLFIEKIDKYSKPS